MHTIIIHNIIHNKHYIIQPLQYDCTKLGQRWQGWLLFLYFWLSRERDRWLGLIRIEAKHHRSVLFCQNETWRRFLRASNCHRRTITLWYVKQQRHYCRPRIHRLQKISIFFLFSHPNHSYANLKEKGKKKEIKQVWSVKIDKRDKLLKVVECPFWMEKNVSFGVTPKETCWKNNVNFWRNQIRRDYKAVRNWIIPLA